MLLDKALATETPDLKAWESPRLTVLGGTDQDTDAGGVNITDGVTFATPWSPFPIEFS